MAIDGIWGDYTTIVVNAGLFDAVPTATRMAGELEAFHGSDFLLTAAVGVSL
jgi:hypothetical protein